jgi:hypothetical protein
VIDDALAGIILSLGSDEPFMIVSCFVDESGSDGDRLLLAGLLAPAENWLRFSAPWKDLLVRSGVNYGHLMEMHANKGAFKNWDRRKKAVFLRQAMDLMERHCVFGLTVSVAIADYKDHYRSNILPRSATDSAYGLCAYDLFMAGSRLARSHISPDANVNFVFESGHINQGNAADIFNDLKQFGTEKCPGLASFALIDKRLSAGLQAADSHAFFSRRYEKKAIAEKSFLDVEPDASLQDLGKALALSGGGFPLFYFSLGPDRLREHAESRAELSRKKRQVATTARRQREDS